VEKWISGHGLKASDNLKRLVIDKAFTNKPWTSQCCPQKPQQARQSCEKTKKTDRPKTLDTLRKTWPHLTNPIVNVPNQSASSSSTRPLIEFLNLNDWSDLTYVLIWWDAIYPIPVISSSMVVTSTWPQMKADKFCHALKRGWKSRRPSSVFVTTLMNNCCWRQCQGHACWNWLKLASALVNLMVKWLASPQLIQTLPTSCVTPPQHVNYISLGLKKFLIGLWMVAFQSCRLRKVRILSHKFP